MPPISGHFQAITMKASKGKTNNIIVGTEYQLKRLSLVAKMKSVNSIAPASPTINPARYNGFLTFDLTSYIPLSFQVG